MIAAEGGASEPPNIELPGKAGGTVAVRRTLANTICRMTIPTQVSRPRQLRDASTVMRLRPAHQSMINRRFNDRASCPARQSLKQTLERKPRIHSPASGKGGHESVAMPPGAPGSLGLTGEQLSCGAGCQSRTSPDQISPRRRCPTMVHRRSPVADKSSIIVGSSRTHRTSTATHVKRSLAG